MQVLQDNQNNQTQIEKQMKQQPLIAHQQQQQTSKQKQLPNDIFALLKLQSIQSINQPFYSSNPQLPGPPDSPYFNNSSPIRSHRDQQIINSLIRSKVSMYMTAKPSQGRLTPLLLASSQKQPKSKLFASVVDMPGIANLNTMVTKQKQLFHIYRQKIDNNFEQCLLFYYQILRCAIVHEYKISQKIINIEQSVLIQCLLFVVRSLVEIGIERLAVYFCIKAIRLCELFREIGKIGQLLYLMACALRKIGRFEKCIILLKKSLEYTWRHRNSISDQLEIQIYNALSQCLLQINAPAQSKIFAYKYQIGYLQRQNSKIIQLSHELIDSVQSRKSKWHAITKQSMELLLQFDIEQFVKKHRNGLLNGRPDQKKVMDAMKVNFQYLYEGFMDDDIFFYQIPTPLEIIAQNRQVKRKVRQGVKFLIKKRSNSVGNLKNQNVKLLKVQHEKPKQFIIFNYRGIGVSKMKLSGLFTDLVKFLRQKRKQTTL